MEKRIQQMIYEGNYLSAMEVEKYLSDHLEQAPMEEAPAAGHTLETSEGPPPMPTGMSFREDYDAIKLAHPGDIVLYQLDVHPTQFARLGPCSHVRHPRP